MFRNLPVGLKIAGGFATILLLLLVAAYVGYDGLTGVTDRVDKADDCNRLVKGILQARNEEKNYIIRQEDPYLAKVDSEIQDVLNQARTTKDKFAQRVNKDQMDSVVEKVTEYSQAFDAYASMDVEKRKTMEEMRAAAREVLKQLEEGRQDQKNQLADGRATEAAFEDDKLTKADDANRLIKWFLEARKHEKEFIISNGGQEWKDSRQKLMDDIMKLAADLKSRFKLELNIQQIDAAITALTAYDASFQKLGTLMQEKVTAMTEMRAEAQEALEQLEDGRQDQKKQLAEGDQTDATFLDDKLTKADDANRMIKWFLEARKNEKEFIISGGGQQWMDAHDDLMDRITKQAADLKGRFKQELNIQQIDAAVTALEAYRTAWDGFAVLMQQETTTMTEMRAEAREALDQLESIHTDQKGQLTEAKLQHQLFLDDKLAKADDANRLIKSFLEARKSEKEFIISNGEQQWKDSRQQLMDDIMKLAADLKSRFKLELNIQQIDAAITALEAYDAGFDRFAALIEQEEETENVMVAAAREAIKTSEDARADQKAKMGSQISRANYVLLASSIVALLLGAVLALLTTIAITAPLKVAVDAANRLAEGDVSGEINVTSKDELGQLLQSMQSVMNAMRRTADAADSVASGVLTQEVVPLSDRDVMGNALAAMVKNLRAQMTELTEGVNVLATATSQISGATAQLVSSATESATAMEETTTTVEEVKQTAEVSSQKARQVFENAEEAAKVSQTGLETVNDVVQGMTRIGEQMGSIADTIVRLSDQSQAIGTIVTAVNNLAEQSNLLSVNASIEAAKAGEYGKGFAVVAQEIRSLADQSKQATTEVRSILNDIQKGISTAVMATEQGGKSVEAGMALSAKAGEAIETLAQQIEEAAGAAAQIAASSQQQLVGMDQVASAMESIKQASTENVASTRQSETSAQNLHDLGQKLKQITDTYTL